jgi:hypothetical protein
MYIRSRGRIILMWLRLRVTPVLYHGATFKNLKILMRLRLQLRILLRNSSEYRYKNIEACLAYSSVIEVK